MWQTLALAFVGGVLVGNGIPHFVKGVTKSEYPCLIGNGSIPNLIGGWTLLVAGAAVLMAADLTKHTVGSFGAIALGVLAIGLFHAGPGARGRKPRPAQVGVGEPVDNGAT